MQWLYFNKSLKLTSKSVIRPAVRGYSSHSFILSVSWSVDIKINFTLICWSLHCSNSWQFQVDVSKSLLIFLDIIDISTKKDIVGCAKELSIWYEIMIDEICQIFATLYTKLKLYCGTDIIGLQEHFADTNWRLVHDSVTDSWLKSYKEDENVDTFFLLHRMVFTPPPLEVHGL